MRRLHDRATADRHASVPNLPLDLRARNVTLQRDQELVEAVTLVFGADDSEDLFHRVRDSFVRARGLPYNAVVAYPSE
jgi:hypothetical protein